MAADIEKSLGIKSALIEDHGGIFEVWLNDQIIYSNHGECCQQYIANNIIKDIAEATSFKKISRKASPPKSAGG